MCRNKRKLVFLIGLMAITLGVFCLVTGVFYVEAAEKRFEGKTIRIMTWSDEGGKAQMRHIGKPFSDRTGAHIITELTGATSEMVAKVKASAAKPQLDLIILSSVGAIELANAGLLEKPDLSKIPNLSEVLPELRTAANGLAVGWLLFCEGLVYNTKTFPSPPTTYEVLWDKKYAERIFLPPPQWVEAAQLTVLAAKMAGGGERSPEPGWKKLEELKGRVLTLAENPPQIAELFRANSLDVGGPYSPAYMPLAIRKEEYNMSFVLDLKEGFFYDQHLMIIPKGHPGDTDVIHEYINSMLDASAQEKMIEAVFYGPTNPNVAISLPQIPPPQRVLKKGLRVDMEYLATVRQEWIKRFTEIFGM